MNWATLWSHLFSKHLSQWTRKFQKDWNLLIKKNISDIFKHKSHNGDYICILTPITILGYHETSTKRHFSSTNPLKPNLTVLLFLFLLVGSFSVFLDSPPQPFLSFRFSLGCLHIFLYLSELFMTLSLSTCLPSCSPPLSLCLLYCCYWLMT